MKRFVRTVVILMAMLCATSIFTGCNSKVVPPGTVVIKLTAGGDVTIYRKGSYTSFGRDRIYFVDTKLASFTEQMKILCKDKVNMTVNVKWIGSFSVEKQNIDIIKEKVPSVKVADSSDITGYRLDLGSFYRIAMKDIVVATARTVVAPYITDDIPENRVKIEADIKKGIVDKLILLGYPVSTADVMLSNLDFDPEVTKTRQAIKKAQLDDEKKAAESEAAIREAQRAEGVAVEEAKAALVRADTEAECNRRISASITPQILAMEQWKVLREAAKGPNNEIFVIPYEAIKSSDVLGSTMNKSGLSRIKK